MSIGKIRKTDKCIDCIVCGGGTAGVATAVSAAKKGLKVALIEKENFLGGTMTGAMTQPMMPNYSPAQEWLNPHFAHFVITEMNKLTRRNISENENFLDPFMLTSVFENLAVSLGIDIWYSTKTIGCTLKNRKIETVIVSNKSGLIELKGRIFADCTGDLDLGVMAGLDFYNGTDAENKHQAVSLRFTMSNVDIAKAISFFEQKQEDKILAGWIDKKKSKGVVSYIYKLFPEDEKWNNTECNQFYIIPGRAGEVNFNCPEIHGCDATNGKDVSNALIQLRGKILRLSNNMIKYYPGFEKAHVSCIAPNLGIRDTKRLKGLYSFCENDVTDGKKFDDGITRGNYGIDIHLPEVKDTIVDGTHRPPKNDYYEIPYRCLISDKISNYITAGRTISSTFKGLAAARIQNIMIGTGWAAGIAAWISTEKKIDINKINGSSIKNLLFDTFQTVVSGKN